jgi:hypothetical protein
MKSTLNFLLIFLFAAIPSMLRAQFERYGLEGRIVYDLAVYGSTIYAATDQGAYARYRFAGRDTGWVLLGLKGKTVRTIYPHQFGPIGYAVTAGVERKPGDPESTLVYCSQFSDTAWAPADTGIARTTINGIRSIRGFPTLAICGETFAGGEGKVYRRPPYPWEKVFDIGIGVTNVVRTREDDATVWVGGETGIFAPYISVSPDKGKTWNTSFPNLGGDNACNSLAFAHGPAPVVYAGMEGSVITSKDSGRTWTSTALSGTPYYFYGLAVYEYGSQSLWAFAGGSTSTGQFGLYLGNIAGSQWTALSPPFSTTGIRCLTTEPGSLFMGTQGDGVLLYKFITPSVSRDGFPDRFSLEQNYPNPFNPTTRLEIGISTPGFVSVKVYDLLGRCVSTLVDERRPAGTYTVMWDAERFPAGVYLCRLTSGSFTATKKMVLLR